MMTRSGCCCSSHASVAATIAGSCAPKWMSERCAIRATVHKPRSSTLVHSVSPIGGCFADERIRETNSFTLGSDFQPYLSAVFTSVGVPVSNSLFNVFTGGVSSQGAFAIGYFPQDARNWSIFTNKTFQITNRISSNFGSRYSDDRKRGIFDQRAAKNDACVAANNVGPTLPAHLQPLVPAAIGFSCFFTVAPVGLGATAPREYDSIFKDNELVYTAQTHGRTRCSPACQLCRAPPLSG